MSELTIIKIIKPEDVGKLAKNEWGGVVFPALSDLREIKEFGAWSSFGERCSFGAWSSFGERCSFGAWSSFGGGSSFGERCSFGRGSSFGGVVFVNYSVIHNIGSHKRALYCFKTEDGRLYFQAGCRFEPEHTFREAVLNKYPENCDYIKSMDFLKTLLSDNQ